MALTKAKKAELISSYKDALKNSKSAVYVKFKGLPVKDTMELRKELFKEKTGYTVVKKTLWDIAVKSEEIKGEIPEVKEEMAVVWGMDLLTPARISYEFSKKHKGSFGILGGIFDGNFKNASEMMAIATIPPREVLLSQLAFLLKSPMQRVAIAISEVAKKK